MRTYYISVLVIFILITSSCGRNDQRIKRRDIVPNRDVISILTDLYIADGLLALPLVYNQFSRKDSVDNYIDIIKRHGYTKEKMDNTINYYIMNNPKKLQKIYDQVLARLSKIQSGLEAESQSSTELNLWNQKTHFSIPEEGIHNSIFFNVPVSDTGMYQLSFSVILFKDDQSHNPRTKVFFWHQDSTVDGTRDQWENVDISMDGSRHNYSINKRLTDTSFTNISGWLLYNDPQPGRWQKHALVSNILLLKVNNNSE
jgi:hypothetical protein